jgi:hypothetical protein
MENREPHPGNADVCENTGVAEKGIRKSMKRKGRQNDVGQERGTKAATPHPRSKCVKTADKGLTGEMYGKATNKGLRGKPETRNLKPEISGGVGERKLENRNLKPEICGRVGSTW